MTKNYLDMQWVWRNIGGDVNKSKIGIVYAIKYNFFVCGKFLSLYE